MRSIQPVLAEIDPQQVEVELAPVQLVSEVSLPLTGELDEMWSFVQKKEKQRWLWHAIDPSSGKVLAYVLGDHSDNMFVKLKTGIRTVWH